MDSNKRRPTGRDCYKCKEWKSYENFPRFANGAIKPFCTACGPAKPGPKMGDRKCRKCGETKPGGEYGWYPCGERKLHCNSCQVRNVRRGKGPWPAPNPCKQCGKTFAVEGFYSHVQSLKTCSPECLELLRSIDNRECRRCKRTLDREHYRKLPGTYATSNTCRTCEQDGDAGAPGISVRPRPTAYQLFCTARDRAKRTNKEFALGRPSVRKLHREACDLCGRAVSSLQLKDESKDWTLDNIRPYCRRCNKLHKVVSYEELLLLSHEIALRKPLDTEDAHGHSRYKDQGNTLPRPPHVKPRAEARVYPAARARRGRSHG